VVERRVERAARTAGRLTNASGSCPPLHDFARESAALWHSLEVAPAANDSGLSQRPDGSLGAPAQDILATIVLKTGS
jgi:hypothetical protein